jgi:hypothetical protein
MIGITEDQIEFLTSTAKKTLYVSEYSDINQRLIANGIFKNLLEHNKKIVVITNNELTADNIFNSVVSYISYLIPYDGVITRQVKAPYRELDLVNGLGKLKCFVEIKPGLCCCGEDADYIYIPDVENISDKTLLGVVMPMMYSDPNTQLFCTSRLGGPYKCDISFDKVI